MRGRVGIPSHKLRSSVIAVVMACCVIGIVTVGSAERVSDSHGPTANQVWRALADSIRFSPRSGAKNVPPDTPIRVASKLGHINDVRVTDLNGAVVPGAWDAAASRWKPKGSLLYGGGYRITASVSGAANLLAQASATFHALSPTNLVTASVYPTTGMQVGGGKPTDPTMGGTHIVLDRETVVRMNSATNGVPVNSPDGYDELVYNDVHISDSGEYVHAAPWSTGSQGNRNVSHGCINLSPANAAA